MDPHLISRCLQRKLFPDAVGSPYADGSGKGNHVSRRTPGCAPVSWLIAPLSLSLFLPLPHLTPLNPKGWLRGVEFQGWGIAKTKQNKHIIMIMDVKGRRWVVRCLWESFDNTVASDTLEKAFPFCSRNSQSPRWRLGKVSQPAPFWPGEEANNNVGLFVSSSNHLAHFLIWLSPLCSFPWSTGSAPFGRAGKNLRSLRSTAAISTPFRILLHAFFASQPIWNW